MKISVIVPVGDEAHWRHCEESIAAAVSAAPGDVAFEVLPCFDLGHKGAFNARNEGLAKATGDWIAWVDCDDEVEPDWASEVSEAVVAHPNVDIIQFSATEIKGGKSRILHYRHTGEIDGGTFAHELLRNDGMPAWLWTRAFKCRLFDGVSFEGRVKHDYGMFLKILPRVRSVWSIGKPLYRYNRHGKGLSNYAQQMDYREAGMRFESSIARLSMEWQSDAKIGLALTMADVARHSKCENGSRRFVRKYLRNVLFDGKVPLRLKTKALLAAVGV